MLHTSVLKLFYPVITAKNDHDLTAILFAI